MKRRVFPILLPLFLASLVVAGCATVLKEESSPLPYRTSEEGTVIWHEEFEFAPPPPEWKLVTIEGGDEFSFAFLKAGGCPTPCQSTFAYDEEPFGYSRDLRVRMEEFFRRFLWASRVTFAKPRMQPMQVLGGEGLAAVAEAKDLVKGQKVMTKVVLGRRGDRVVSFYLTQWRTTEGTYDPQEVEAFDRFVESFRFLKKSFYETL